MFLPDLQFETSGEFVRDDEDFNIERKPQSEIFTNEENEILVVETKRKEGSSQRSGRKIALPTAEDEITLKPLETSGSSKILLSTMFCLILAIMKQL